MSGTLPHAADTGIACHTAIAAARQIFTMQARHLKTRRNRSFRLRTHHRKNRVYV